MRKIYTDNLKRYQYGKYKGKIDWGNNIGEKLNFVYNDISGEIEIINYVKDIPQGTVYVKFEDNVQPMKTNNLIKCSISNLIGRLNYNYLYNIGDIINTKFGGDIIVLDQIKIFHTKYHERGYNVKCLDCNHTYNIREVHISSCPNCSDRVSYPEKFVINLFRQLGEQIELQKTFDWAGLKRYDLYIPQHNMIIEVNGLIHYEHCFFNMIGNYNSKTDMYQEFKRIQDNDLDKFELAIENGIIYYITIDAKESNVNYIKESILTKSQLSTFYDLTNIDWLRCHEFALKSVIKKSSELWNNKISLDEICNILKLNKCTLQQYLSEGNKLGYCIYDKHINMSTASLKSAKSNYKPVICLNTGEIFESQTAATKAYNIYKTGVTDCCSGRIPSAGKHPTTGESLKWANYNIDDN